MEQNMDYMMSNSDATTITEYDCATCKTRYATTESMRSHFARLEARMDRIEGTLNTLVDRLPVSNVDEDRRKKRRLDISTTEDDDSPTFLDKTFNFERQQPAKELNMTHTMNQQHIYSPLDPTKSQIRLLKLHRAERFSDPLVANLVLVSLDDDTNNLSGSLDYVALSYAWGSAASKGLITIDGGWFPITKSLEAALRQRRSNRRGLFGTDYKCWVDQICINQSDLDERSSQVNLMRRIYKKAHSVHVWLGEEADDSSLAIDILEKLGKPPPNAPGEKEIVYPTLTEEDIMRNWDALRALFKRPWWQRVWIRQEIALHRTVQLWCGSKSFDMATLEPALAMLTDISALGYRSSVSYSENESTVVLPWDFHARMLVQLRNLTANGSYWVGLAQLLRNTRGCEATDSRDMVFSVLGMADPKIYPIIPDYRRNLRQILLSTAQVALGQRFGLEILGACQNPEKKSGLPSWVPLVEDKWRAMPFQSMATGRGGAAFSTGRFLTKAERPGIKVEDEVLALQGGVVDTVASICKLFVGNNSHVGDLESVYSSWKSFAEDASMRLQLGNKDYRKFIESKEPEKMSNWMRFLTMKTDVGIFGGSSSGRLFGGGLFGQTTPNPSLARSYLLPSSHVSADPPLNHEINAGLKLYGVGRRLGITSRGYLCLLPAETQKGDFMALFQGATFPYVLRKLKGQNIYVLVGEAFIPSWWHANFGEEDLETLSTKKWKVDTKSWIRIC